MADRPGAPTGLAILPGAKSSAAPSARLNQPRPLFMVVVSMLFRSFEALWMERGSFPDADKVIDTGFVAGRMESRFPGATVEGGQGRDALSPRSLGTGWIKVM